MPPGGRASIRVLATSASSPKRRSCEQSAETGATTWWASATAGVREGREPGQQLGSDARGVRHGPPAR